MSGISMRLGQLFDEKSGRAFVVAYDHGQALPMAAKAGKPVDVVRRIIAGSPEGVLLSAGMLAQTSDLFATHGAPATLVRADWTTMAEPRMKKELGDCYRILVEPEDVLALGGTAAIVYLIGWPTDGTTFADNAQAVAGYVRRAHRAGLPVIVEATLWGSRNKDQKDPDDLRHMCRIGAELGADALKTEFVGDIDAEKAIIEGVGNIPVLTLGGIATSPEKATEAAREAVEAGARGLIFGRNVWQAPDMEATMKKLSHIVHSK